MINQILLTKNKIVVIIDQLDLQQLNHCKLQKQMKRYQGKQRQITISEKVKKMFRYSPSYKAQKCHSKLPLRTSNTFTSTMVATQKQNDINCEYSSVNEKHLETNQCNDTSSWIAKLVNGINDDDEENKNLNKLSHIENKSVSDLPEDSQDYGYNEFLMEQCQSLFLPKEKQKQKNKPQIFEEQVTSILSTKKSIKQAMIQIQMQQNSNGLRGPPVTRDSSCTKRQHHQKNKNDKQSISKEKKSLQVKKDKKQNHNSNPKKSSLPEKYIPERKRKIKTLQKMSQKSVVVEKLNRSQNEEKFKKKAKTIEDESILQYQTSKNSLITTSTKKQSIGKIKNQVSAHSTRKNSFIRMEQHQNKEELTIVDQHSKDLNMKNLFDADNSVEQKCQTNQTANMIGSIKQKRVGAIKKNKVKRENQLKSKNMQNQDVRQDLNIISGRFKQKSSSRHLQPNAFPRTDSNNFTLNFKSHRQYPQVNHEEDKSSSYRRNILSSLQSTQRETKISQETGVFKGKERTNAVNQSVELKRKVLSISWENNEQIRSIFNKIRLDHTNPLVSKNNLKLRGLSQQQKTQLGSIITKIHYQNVQFDFESFSKQFTKLNIECTQKGCLSQQNFRKTNEIQMILGNTTTHVQKFSNRGKNQKQNYRFNYTHQGNFELEETLQLQDSKGITENKMLLQQTNRRSYQDNIPVNRINKNVRLAENNKLGRESISSNISTSNRDLNIKEETIQNLSREPYVEAPSLVDIQLTKRDISSFRNSIIESIRKLSNNNQVGSMIECSPSQRVDDSGLSLIDRLNRKLSSYIDKNQIQSTYRQFNLNFSELKKHIR